MELSWVPGWEPYGRPATPVNDKMQVWDTAPARSPTAWCRRRPVGYTSRGMTVAAAFPRRINVEVTNHCNQRCPLCPRQGFTRPLGFMDRALYERIVEECALHGARVWLHFLGEPLLHRGLVDMIRFAKRAGVPEVGLSTNGVSLRGRLAGDLLESGLDRLECSMDADDRESYRAMRGRDHFDLVTRNVHDFLVRKRA